MQLNYHSALTKIQKLQKKKRVFFFLFLVPAGIAQNWLIWLVFKLIRNVGVSIPVYVSVRYIPADTTDTGTVSTTLEGTHHDQIQKDHLIFTRQLCLEPMQSN